MKRTMLSTVFFGFAILATYLFVAGNLLMIQGRSDEWVVYALGALTAGALAYAFKPGP